MTTRVSSPSLHDLGWPAEQLGEAIEAVARHEGIAARPADLPALPASVDAEGRGAWVDLVASHLGIEAEPFQASYADVGGLVKGVAPAIVRLPPREPGGEARWLAMGRSGLLGASVIAPDRSVHRVPSRDVREALCRPAEAGRRATTLELLARAGVAEEARERVLGHILGEQLAGARVAEGWLLRVSPGATLWQQAQKTGLRRPLLGMVAGDLLQQGALFYAWWLMGRGALHGELSPLSLSAWALLLFSGVPLQLLATRAQGRFATRLGTLYKSRLLFGTSRLHPEEIRHQGMGQFLGRTLDADSVERLSLGGGLTALAALTQLVATFGVLSAGAVGWVHVAALTATLLVTTLLAWSYWRANRELGDAHREMTNDLVERMVGHRTRIAQERPEAWHADEDRDLDRYVARAILEGRAGLLLSAVPRAWMVVGLGGIVFRLMTGDVAPAALALSLGGVLLAYQALSSLVANRQPFVDLGRAYRQIKPLMLAAGRVEKPASVALPARAAPPLGAAIEKRKSPVLVAKDLAFRYRDRGRYTLDGCDVEVREGDRVLLEGPSGAGKSTLAAVLAGLREAESGLLLLRGYDRPSVGPTAWRQRVAVAPQFHENHVLADTLAFNLLMGRRWPPREGDLEEAERLCRELGLGDLLDRMPSGLLQMVGESGWQLSHGERSRLYVARTLLQEADLIILDESFAALDPATLELSLRCVLRRAPALIVIAHP